MTTQELYNDYRRLLKKEKEVLKDGEKHEKWLIQVVEMELKIMRRERMEYEKGLNWADREQVDN